MTNAASSNAIRVVSSHTIVEVVENIVSRQRSIHTLTHFKKGDVICTFSAEKVFSTPNYLTVQTGLNTHISLLPSFLQYSNHSCNPNFFFDTTAMEIVALKDIEPKEELCFFYPSTELDMAQPFICYCGSKDCLQNIRGAKHIPVDILNRFQLTNFIKEQIRIPL